LFNISEGFTMNQNSNTTDSAAVLELKHILATANLNEYEKRGLQLCIESQIEQEKQAQKMVAKHITRSDESQTLSDMKHFLATAKLTEAEKRGMQFMIRQQEEHDQFIKDMTEAMADSVANRAEIALLQAELLVMSNHLAEHDLEAANEGNNSGTGNIQSTLSNADSKGFEHQAKGTQAHVPFIDDTAVTANPMELIFDTVNQMHKKLSDNSNPVEAAKPSKVATDEEIENWGKFPHEIDAERNARRLSIIDKAQSDTYKENMPALENLAIKVGNKALDEYEHLKKSIQEKLKG